MFTVEPTTKNLRAIVTGQRIGELVFAEVTLAAATGGDQVTCRGRVDQLTRPITNTK
ncbi:MAG: hypothetical protein VW268_05400 [Rhodospirillaceae bacterium]